MNSTLNVSNITVKFIDTVNSTMEKTDEEKKETDVLFVIIFTICCLIYMAVALYCIFDGVSKFNSGIVGNTIVLTINFETFNDKLKNYMKTHRVDIDVECAICYENGNMVKTDCDHIYCDKCLSKWIEHNHTCPLCRDFII